MKSTPNQPWLARKQWCSPTLKDRSSVAVYGSWILTLIINAIAWPAAFSWMNQPPSGANRYIAFVLPAGGLALAGRALFLTLRRVKFGRSILHLETVPGCIGGWLAGTIETRLPVVAKEIHVDLTCMRKVSTRRGKSSYVEETTLLEKAQVLDGSQLPVSPSRGGSAIPIAFKIPAKAKSTERPDNRHEVVWQLTVRAKVDGPDYRAEFVVPVFDAGLTQAADFMPEAERVASTLRLETSPKARARRADSSVAQAMQ